MQSGKAPDGALRLAKGEIITVYFITFFDVVGYQNATYYETTVAVFETLQEAQAFIESTDNVVNGCECNTAVIEEINFGVFDASYKQWFYKWNKKFKSYRHGEHDIYHRHEPYMGIKNCDIGKEQQTSEALTGNAQQAMRKFLGLD